MTSDPFTAFVAFQEEVLSFQQRAIDAGADMIEFQKRSHEAAAAGAKAWARWFELWTPKR